MMNEATTHGGDPLARRCASRPRSCAIKSTRHLERARLAARVAVIGTVTDVRPVVFALARTMERLHHDRGVAIDIDAAEGARFRGEQQDLEEMVGNLVDNACKWAQSRVAVEVFSEKPDPRDDRRVVRIVVDDDGPGLSPQQREQVARRGRRLDETKPGSGLGLSIVVESRQPVRRRAHARNGADRGLAGGVGAPGSLSGLVRAHGKQSFALTPAPVMRPFDFNRLAAKLANRSVGLASFCSR